MTNTFDVSGQCLHTENPPADESQLIATTDNVQLTTDNNLYPIFNQGNLPTSVPGKTAKRITNNYVYKDARFVNK